MRNKKGQLSLGVIVMLFIGIIVALALINPIFNTQNVMTSKQTVSNQSQSTVTAWYNATEVNEATEFTLFSDQNTWKITECPLTSVTIRNGAGTELTDDTDYTLTESTGVYTLLNTSLTIPDIANNLTYADYTHCADGYNTDAASRSMAGLIGLFAAIALMAFTVLGIKGYFK